MHVFVSNHIESFVLFVLITALMLGNTTAVVEDTRDTEEDEKFLNQARAGRTWFLKITSVRMYVCVRPPGY